jgi:hypothetical protein
MLDPRACYTASVLDTGVDIVVTSPTGHRSLVVEAKLSGSLEEATSQLREYMRAVGADVGLVVMRDQIRILREMYRGEPSIQVVGELPTHLADGLVAARDEVDFEDRIQHWLESLRDQDQSAADPRLAALVEHVLPALAEGTVRAARPRLHRAIARWRNTFSSRQLGGGRQRCIRRPLALPAARRA